MRLLNHAAALAIWPFAVACWVPFAILFRLLNHLNYQANDQTLEWRCAGIQTRPEPWVLQ